jgi:hypothetical protein
MKVNLMGKQYALNIAVTAEELKDKPAKVIRNRSGPPVCYPRLASPNNQRGYNRRWAVPTNTTLPGGSPGTFHSSLSGARWVTSPLEPPRGVTPIDTLPQEVYR